jgi:hypothetical protein
LATVRWQILLRIQGIWLSWLQAGAIVMIGLFFNLFLPGGVGRRCDEALLRIQTGTSEKDSRDAFYRHGSVLWAPGNFVSHGHEYLPTF